MKGTPKQQQATRAARTIFAAAESYLRHATREHHRAERETERAWDALARAADRLERAEAKTHPHRLSPHNPTR